MLCCRLVKLMDAFPCTVTQRRLQSLEIQSKFLLNNFNLFRLWRLHHSIPYKVFTAEKVGTSDRPVENKPDAAENPVSFDEVETIPSVLDANVNGENRVVRIPVLHMPSNTKTRWTPAEIAILGNIKEHHQGLKLREQYKLYIEECKRLGIQDRSIMAVRKK